jgi:hypothetical protein
MSLRFRSRPMLHAVSEAYKHFSKQMCTSQFLLYGYCDLLALFFSDIYEVIQASLEAPSIGSFYFLYMVA